MDKGYFIIIKNHKEAITNDNKFKTGTHIIKYVVGYAIFYLINNMLTGPYSKLNINMTSIDTYKKFNHVAYSVVV